MDKLIIFDFFGVICSEVAPFWFEKHFSEDEAKRIKRDLVGLADRGEISLDDLFLRLGEMVNISPARVSQEWFSYVKIDSVMVWLLA